MGCILSLFLAELRRYWIYYLITVVGVGAAVAGVVWNFGSFSTAENQYDVYARRLLGGYHLAVGSPNPYAPRRPQARPPEPAQRPANPPTTANRPETGRRGGPPGARRGGGDEAAARWAASIAFPVALDWLREQPEVGEVQTAAVCSVVLRSKRPWTGPPLTANLFAVNPATFSPPAELPPGQWLSKDGRADECIVIDRQQADRMQVRVGETIGVTQAGAQIKFTVCGICEATRPFGRSGNVYVTTAAAARILGKPEPPPSNLALVKLADPAAVAAFAEVLRGQARDLQVATATDIAASLDGGRQGFADMGKWVILLSLVASLLIVFTTLNLGLAKRLRQFGLLRAVGANRCQVGALLLLESLLLGALGTLFGLLLGYLVLVGTAARHAALYPNGAVLSPWVFIWAAVCGLGGALAATLLPAVAAMRQSPLSMMANESGGQPRRRIAWAAVLGLLLLVPALILSAPIVLVAATRAKWFGMIGLPGILVGGVLLAPALVVLVGRLVRPLLALIFRLPATLVDAELTRHLGRSVAVAMALAAGFGSFVAVSTWGSTMLKPFLPTPDCPDLALTFRPNGLPPEALADLQAVPGFKQCLPVYTRQFRFGPETQAAIERNAIVKGRAGGVILVGLDLRQGLLGPDPLFAPNLLGGDPDTAIARLEAGTHCLIPSSFASQANLKTGDFIELGAPADADTPAEAATAPLRFAVAGIYTTPWHLLTKKAGMRGLHGSGADVQAMILVAGTVAQPLARNERLTTFWINYTDDFRALPTDERLDRLHERFETLTQACGPGTYTVPETGETIHLEAAWANIGDMPYVIEGIHEHAGNIIGGMARLPLWSLLVAALALANTMTTSMRIRRWSLGVMRAIGLSRSQLLRLVFAEALLVGICGCAIGLIGGLYSGWVTARLAHYVFHFSGITIEMVIPWPALLRGTLLALATMLPAALVPAIATASRQPLDLLQEGKLSL
ncbi:MAG: ABC transporter permease [Lentisphaeria bacterium]|jgi:putative ABC transport system permease protein|nr:ABC transporter permease [Lentisphaeria bacterium]